MKEETSSFIFYKSFYEAIEKLPNLEDRYIIFQSICNYSFNNVEPKLDGLTSIIWTLIKPQIDANKKKREDGKKGGAPKGNQNARKQPKTTIVDLQNNHRLNEKQPNDNVNENVNANDNVNANENKNINANAAYKNYMSNLQLANEDNIEDIFSDFWNRRK